jgi:hypothetical protein
MRVPKLVEALFQIILEDSTMQTEKCPNKLERSEKQAGQQ